MVLCLKTWESRSLPGLQRTKLFNIADNENNNPSAHKAGGFFVVRANVTQRNEAGNPLALAGNRRAENV
jgi:hypothetical protein